MNLTLKTGKKHYFYDLYEIAFFSVETNSTNHRVEPGVHVKKGTYIHHTSGAILPNRDNNPFAIYIAQDSIAYTYYIHHQRLVDSTESVLNYY